MFIYNNGLNDLYKKKSIEKVSFSFVHDGSSLT